MTEGERKSVVGGRIREARTRLGMTQADLARLVGTEESSVPKWETGKSLPGSQKMPIIADMLGVSVDWLYGRDASTEEEISAQHVFHCLPKDDQRQYLRQMRALLKDLRSRDAGQPGAQNVYLAHHDRWALAQVS